MINSQFALGLRAVACSQLQPQHIRAAMQMLENESAKLNISNEPMDFISYFLHFLYTSPVPSIRASVLRIISNFSVNSGKYIIEQYKYDRIIAASVDQKLQENVNIDEEKLAAFKNIFVIVDFFHKFPKSIIRALVSFYETAPRSFKKLIEVTLAKGILLCDHFPNIQDVSDIIINSLLASGSDSLIGLLGFIFEKQYIRVVDCHFAEKLITPLSNFGGGINSENAENIIKIFTMLLKTWPGLLCFGIQMRGLLDLTETISKNPTILIKILSNLLLLDGPKHSVIDSYVGFLFYNLLNFNILEKLNELSNNQKNAATVLAAIELLQQMNYVIPDKAVYQGFGNVTKLTGLQGRWQRINDIPKVICDTGHNIGGIQYIVRQLNSEKYRTLRIVIGMVNDKDINGVLSILPQDAIYYFTQASIPRALPAQEMMQKGLAHGLIGTHFPTVKEAYKKAINDSDPSDLIFVGGSTFIVADLLSFLKQKCLTTKM